MKRPDGQREFDNLLLVTPNEGLSAQHLVEFAKSGIEANLLIEDRTAQRTFDPRVKVIEIHKLAEEAWGEGVSVPVEELGGANLVFVDEGHKGTGSEAQTWKRRQRRLSANGFLLEYSATFAQSIGAASRRVRGVLLAEYGKCILLDYSYRHFYDDGYGKDFAVLNLARARVSQAHELLVGGLLTFYRQYRLFHRKQNEYRPYNLEKPLWVFLGSSVNAIYTEDKARQSDVATVVDFLRRFLEDQTWANRTINKIMEGESGFTDEETKADLFQTAADEFKGQSAGTLHREICRELFHGSGGLEVWELKNAEGEFGLRVSTTKGQEAHYFGVINIGDVSAFKNHLKEHLKLDVKEDRFTKSLFAEINQPDSHTNLLIGSKKFIEGWSSWRVSAMGLLNIGKGEGPQVIQLFGRGVRLKGKKWTLKRSARLPEAGPHPDGLPALETLFIFGWNANYISAFREIIEREEIGREITIQLKLFEPWPTLPIPQPRAGYNVDSETWTLEVEPLNIAVDLTPRISTMAGARMGAGQTVSRTRVDFGETSVQGLIDTDALHADLLEYKFIRGYTNTYLPRNRLLPILQQNDLYLASADAIDPATLHEGGSRLLKAYLDRFVARKEREAESCQLEPGVLLIQERSVPYRVRVRSDELLREIEALLRRPAILYRTADKPLPRLHVDKHLFSPLLLDPEGRGLEDVTVSPPGLGSSEEKLLKDIAAFWAGHHRQEPYAHFEVFLFRNLPRVGVGFFRRSGFYPDFILWLKNNKAKSTHIRFLEPHGMHHGGLKGNETRIDSLKELEQVSREDSFQNRKVTLDGYILTQTKLAEIPDAHGKSWETLERDFRVIRQDTGYAEKIVRLT